MGTLVKSGTAPFLSLGGMNIPFDPVSNSNHVVLFVCSDAATPNSTLRKIGTSAGYQVPAGKTLKLIGARITNQAAQLCILKFLYSDNDMGYNTATAPTNPVYPQGAIDEQVCGISTIGAILETGGILHEVPAGKYPGHIGPGGASVFQGYVYGILV